MYEVGRLLAEPVLPPLYRQVRSQLRTLTAAAGTSPRILDVGGRKSPYSIGLPAKVTVIDLPRESEIQRHLNLGVDHQIIEQIKVRRSNVEDVILGDMTASELPDRHFDIAVSVEVLEHVEEDGKFVTEVCRILKPGGVFLMTTPNGDWVKNTNPDHKRHYKRDELVRLLEKHFCDVRVNYAIASGRCRTMGLKSWSISKPAVIAMSAVGNIINSLQSAGSAIKQRAEGTHHLIAVAIKARS